MVIAPWWPAGRVNRPRAGDPRSDPLARYDRRGNPRAVGDAGSMTAPDPAIPQVAVVTAAYNMEKYIGATIASVLEQSLASFEMVVVDDGSRDTAKVVTAADDPRVRLISIPNSGVAAARNRGLSDCRAPLVIFLDGDDLLRPRALERMVATMAANPGHVACFGHHIKIDEDRALRGSRAPSALRRLPARDTLRHLLRKNMIVNGGALHPYRSGAPRRWLRPKPRLRRTWNSGAGWPGSAISSRSMTWCWSIGCAAPAPAGRWPEPRFAPTSKLSRSSSPHRRCERFASASYGAIVASPRSMNTGSRRGTHSPQGGWCAAQYLVAGLLRYPDSVFQWRLVYLFLRNLTWQRG